MSNVFEGEGSCLCGAVSFIANEAGKSIGACHCSMCRKWGGGPAMLSPCEGEVVFSGEDNIAVYDSSDWAERGFCQLCGSHLFYRMKKNHQYFLPVGIFDSQDFFSFDRQIYIDNKPSFYRFENDTTEMTEAQALGQE